MTRVLGKRIFRDRPSTIVDSVETLLAVEGELDANLTKTEGDMAFPMDYNSGAAVDPPVGTIFKTQTEIDDFLTANSATHFKHFDKAFNALPQVLDNHYVSFDFVVGKHFLSPDAGTDPNVNASMELKKVLRGPNGGIDFFGDYGAVVDAQFGLTDLVVTGNGFEDGFYYCDFAGTPFALLDIRGMVISHTLGYPTLPSYPAVVRHTDSRIWITGALSIAVNRHLDIGWPSTLLVAGPATGTGSNKVGFLFRNIGTYRKSYNWMGFWGMRIAMNDPASAPNNWNGIAILADTDHSCYDGGQSVIHDTVIAEGRIEEESLITGPSNNNPYASDEATVKLQECSVTSYDISASNKGGRGGVLVGRGAAMSLRNCFVGYRRTGLDALRLQSACLEAGSTAFASLEPVYVVQKPAAITLLEGSILTLSFNGVWFFGLETDPTNPVASQSLGHAAILVKGGNVFASVGSYIGVIDHTKGPCIIIADGAKLDLQNESYDQYAWDQSQGGIKGNNNVDVAIQFVGSNASLRVPKLLTTITGNVGDVRMADGTVLTWAQIDAYGGVTDSRGNSIVRFGL